VCGPKQNATGPPPSKLCMKGEVAHFRPPVYPEAETDHGLAAVSLGEWAGLGSQGPSCIPYCLFNLTADLAEMHDLAADMAMHSM
jgi:hypothetical protein